MYFTLDQIDRGIYEAVREVLVQMGYTPDVVAFPTQSAYDAELQNIKDSGKSPVNLYGVGAWKAKNELKYSTIVIERTREALSPLGYRGTTYFEPDGAGKFDLKQTPMETVEITYTVSVVCKGIADERTLSYLMRKALGVTKQLRGVNEDGTTTQNTFRVFRDDIVDVSAKNMIEKKMVYRTSEVFLEQDSTIGGKVSQISEIKIDLN